MKENEFDRAFSNFLDDEQCERNSEAVYALIRDAYTAGWRAAMDLGGQHGQEETK